MVLPPYWETRMSGSPFLPGDLLDREGEREGEDDVESQSLLMEEASWQ